MTSCTHEDEEDKDASCSVDNVFVRVSEPVPPAHHPAALLRPGITASYAAPAATTAR